MRWPKDGWELLMREESEAARRGREREMGGEMRPEERATAPERVLEQVRIGSESVRGRARRAN